MMLTLQSFPDNVGHPDYALRSAYRQAAVMHANSQSTLLLLQMQVSQAVLANRQGMQGKLA